MIPYIGDFAEDATVYHYFNTFDSNDPSESVTITQLIDSDLKVHKDGGTTEIATDGATITINFDSRTGVHLVTIDTSAHADYSTGSDYVVLMEGTDIDSGTVNAALFTFSIENRYDVTASVTAGVTLAADAITADKIADDAISSEHLNTGALTADAFAANALVAGTFAASSLDGKGDWNTGTPPTAAAIADAVLDEDVTDHLGASALGAYIQAIYGDTNEMQTDDIPALIAAVQTVVDKIPLSDGSTIWNNTALAAIKVQGVAALATQMTESYAADGVDPTPAQALFMIQQMLTAFAINGTTLTVKKINKSNTAATFTHDNATLPTSLTRAT